MLSDKTLKAFAITTDAEASKKFYGEKLGFKLLSADDYGLEFELQHSHFRVSVVPAEHAEPRGYTIAGWCVPDIVETVKQLKERGIVFERYDFAEQDENDIWTAPGGTKVAWFKDNHGNILSIDQAP